MRIHQLLTLMEGGNLSIDGHDAQQIDLKVHNRGYIVPILSTLLNSINAGFQRNTGGLLWSPKVLKSRKYLSGSSLHFFNTDISDEEFERIKPKVGDIDTQVNKTSEAHLAQYLNSVKGKVVGNAKFLGYSRGNEQYSSLWELTDPPIKVQIDFEFVDYSEKEEPTDWAAFSHSSGWDDLLQGIKGVFHKFLIQSLSKISSQEFILRKVHKRTGKVTDKVEKDSMLSFAVSSKEGGGLRPKYEPVLDESGRPLQLDGLPVLKELPPASYEKDIGKIFQTIFDKRIDRATLAKVLPKAWSFTGLLELMNLILQQEEKESVIDSFVDKLFAPGAQGLYKGDPHRDLTEKNTALNHALKVLNVTPPINLEQMRQAYVKNYRVTTTEGPIGLDRPIYEAEEGAQVKAQLRKGMPHLHDLKSVDPLDLLDEIHDGNSNFKLQNIPLNVKVDGFGGRFGKNAEGKPFMGTSRTEPRYQAGFVDYHQKKGTTDLEILGRAKLFDELFHEMMRAVKLVDSKLGSDFLVDKQVTCEVLYLPFATETPEGRLKFVGIHYDKLPTGVRLALVPFRVTNATTGEDLPDSNQICKELTSVGKMDSVMFIDNSLTQNEALDVTALVPPIENIVQFKAMLASRRRDQAAEVKAALEPVALALEKAIIEDPNIVGKELLGSDYEGIVINSRLGPIKVTSTEQRRVIAAKNDAKASARTERPRGEAKIAVVAIGSFVGHKGHEDLFKYTIAKAKELGGDPYLFIGNAEGKDDPIPPAVKVQTWHKLYPEYANNISTVQAGGSLIQKLKHELINPLPGKPPRYDNIIIMVGEDRAGLAMPQALMKAVNKFQGYEHVRVSLEVTPRESGFSGTMLRRSLKNDPPEKALDVWCTAFDVQKLGVDWIKHLMDLTRQNMGIPKSQAIAEMIRKIRPLLKEGTTQQKIRMLKLIKEATQRNNTVLNEFYDSRASKPEGGKIERLVRKALANNKSVFVRGGPGSSYMSTNGDKNSGYVVSEHPVKGFLVRGSGRHKFYTTFDDQAQKVTGDADRMYIQSRSSWNPTREIDLDKLDEFAPPGSYDGDDSDIQLYIDVAKKVNMKKYKAGTAHDLIAKKMAGLVDVVDDEKVDYARHVARKAQGMSNMLETQLDEQESTLNELHADTLHSYMMKAGDDNTKMLRKSFLKRTTPDEKEKIHQKILRRGAGIMRSIDKQGVKDNGAFDKELEQIRAEEKASVTEAPYSGLIQDPEERARITDLKALTAIFGGNTRRARYLESKGLLKVSKKELALLHRMTDEEGNILPRIGPELTEDEPMNKPVKPFSQVKQYPLNALLTGQGSGEELKRSPEYRRGKQVNKYRADMGNRQYSNGQDEGDWDR